jgi:hypothetical protein
MPVNHQYAASLKGWTREYLLRKAARIGSATSEVPERILGNSIYMEQNYKSCFGLIMLEKRFTRERIEPACSLALTGTRINYTMIKNILNAGTDKQCRNKTETQLPKHENIRGSQHYN